MRTRCVGCVAGLDSLCRADKRFTPFQDKLFSRASLSVSRDQLTRDENNQLDANLRAFLHVLTNHFLAPAAFQGHAGVLCAPLQVSYSAWDKFQQLVYKLLLRQHHGSML